MTSIPSSIADATPTRNLLQQQVILVACFFVLTVVSLLVPMEGLVIPLQHYLPLHTVFEFVSISVAFLVFATIWHTPTNVASSALFVIGISLFSAGWMDIFHTLSYKGMPDFVSPSSVEKAIAFWLIARFFVAAGLLLVSVRPEQSPISQRARYGALACFALVNLLLTWLIVFHESDLPHTYIDKVGLTPLKLQLEWLITGMMTVAAARFYWLARKSENDFLPLIFSATAIAALGETFFTQYAVVSDYQNLLGHVLKLISYALIYKAMFIISIRRPYQELAQRKRLLVLANEALRVHSFALDSTATPVLVTDLQGHVYWRNRTAMKLSPELFADQADKLRLFAPPLTPDTTQAVDIESTVKGGNIWRGMVRLVSASGKRYVFDRTVTPLRNEEGTMEGYVIVGDNVTDRLSAQMRHKRVLDMAIDGFCVVNRQGRVIEVNEAYTRLSGYSEAELLSMRIDQLDTTHGFDDVRATIEKICYLGALQFETQHRRKTGGLFWVDISATYDLDSGNIFVFVRDRTERVHAAAIKQDLERQLQQAQKMEALGQLTGGIAHDFNNILAAVLGYSSLALERFAPDKQGKLAAYLREIISASERAKDLIAKMLTFARQKPSITMDEISPAAVVDDVFSMLSHSIPSGIELTEIIKDRLKIRMDAGELNQMLVNLIINARDAIGDQGRIEVSLHRWETKGEICAASQQRLFGTYLALDVSDNGSGIAPEHLPRLFDPFFTTKEVGKGSGLGLSMVQGILLRSNGHIVVTSELGKGSRFRLLFPIASPSKPNAEILEIRQTTTPGAGQNIWVIDDETAVVSYLGELLETAGYSVRLFTDPFQVLGAFGADQKSVDLLITDQTMPGLNGMALAQRLLTLRPELPVILCSGYSENVDQDKLLSLNIRRYFNKPVPAHDLLSAVAQELAQVPSQVNN